MTKLLSMEDALNLGVIQEVNRLLLHSRGLALTGNVSNEPVTQVFLTDASVEAIRWLVHYATALEEVAVEWGAPLLEQLAECERYEAGSGFFTIRDDRDDPEGIYFGDLDVDDVVKGDRFALLRAERATARLDRLGYVVESLPPPRKDAPGCAACEGDPEAHGLHVCGKEPYA